MNRIIGIENEPRKKQLFMLAAAALCMGTGVTWFRITAISTCMSSHGAKTVTIAMTLAMLILPFIGMLYTRLTTNCSLAKTVHSTYGILMILMAAIALFGMFGSIGVVSPLMVLLIKLFSMFTFVPFWQLVAKTFPGQKSCRSCMVITAGFPVSQIIAGATMTHLVTRFGQLFPVFAAIIAIGLTAALIQIVIRDFSEMPIQEKSSLNKKRPKSTDKLRRQTVLVFGTTALVTVISVLMTYIFQTVTESFVSSHEELTSILGVIEIAIGSLELFVMLFVSANLISRWGVLPGLLALPVVISLLSVLMLTGALGSATLLFFVAAIAHVTEAVTKPAFAKPSLKLLIDLSPVTRRMRMVAQVETICKPIVSALAGGLILLFAALPGFGVGAVIAVLLVCAVIWVFAGASAHSLYRGHQTPAQAKQQVKDSAPMKQRSTRPSIRTRIDQLIQSVHSAVVNLWKQPTFGGSAAPPEPASICGDSLILTMQNQSDSIHE